MEVGPFFRSVWTVLLTSILVGNHTKTGKLGDLTGEFWLGNDNLHRLTAADDVILRVALEDLVALERVL